MALLLLGSGGPAGAAPGPFLKTSGLDIRNDSGQGEVVPLRGVNLGSWLLMEDWMCPMDSSGNLTNEWMVREKLTQRFGAATKDSLMGAYQDAWLMESDFDNITALGMNCIRLPFWYLNLQEDDGTWRADAFHRLDWAVSNAWERGIYTILDLHGAPGGQTANAKSTGRSWPTAALWTNSTYQARTRDIWARVSAHYNGNPAVAGYDLLNEPMDTPSSSVYWNFLNACYQTIRTNDPDHIILMEATYGSWNLDMLPNPASYGWTNVVYQLHSYPWGVWNDVPLLNAETEKTIQDCVNHQGWNVPCHVGEFNMAPEEAWKYAIERYSTSGLGWQMWAYKSTFTGGITSWGIYNPNGTVTAIPNIENNSSSQIRSKWAAWTTAGAFTLNQSHKRTMAMPVAKDDAYTLDVGAVLTVAAAQGVLSNDTHLNLGGAGIQLQAVKMSNPANGTVSLVSNGSFVYTASPGFSGLDSFRYKVWDGRIDSVRNATVSIQVVSNSAAGPVTQLIWTTQPGLATNGWPFVQQPVLQTADQYGNPSTNALPAVLNVSVLLSAGTGPLQGTTNVDLGAASGKGVMQFTNLQIDSAGNDKQLIAQTRSITNFVNRLTNGGFTVAMDGWTKWTTNGGWANREIPGKLQPTNSNYWPAGVGVYDGTPQLTCGGGSGASGGAYQIVPAVAGSQYTLALQAGAENWWLPTGEIRLFFLDAANQQLALTTVKTTDSIHNPDRYDVGVPYQNWSLTATAPAGTTKAKVELTNPVGTGSAWFDNVSLTEWVSAPVLAAATTLPFTVHPAPPAGTPTNYVAGITAQGGGVFSLQFVGQMGAQYYVQTATNLSASVAWEALAGSTNTVTNLTGLWPFSVTSTEPQRFYRSVALPH